MTIASKLLKTEQKKILIFFKGSIEELLGSVICKKILPHSWKNKKSIKGNFGGKKMHLFIYFGKVGKKCNFKKCINVSVK